MTQSYSFDRIRRHARQSRICYSQSSLQQQQLAAKLAIVANDDYERLPEGPSDGALLFRAALLAVVAVVLMFSVNKAMLLWLA